MNLQSIPRKTASVVTRKTGSEGILVPVINNIADMEAVYTLNETAFAVWDIIDGKKTIKSISEDIAAMFDIDYDTALKDTLELMLDLESHRMISE